MIHADAAGRRLPKVLIVDDDPDAVKFLADRCGKMGLAVLTAADGMQALAVLRQSAPDVMIVDVHMPELDGLSLCSRMIDPQHIGIDVIVTSGYSDRIAEERCKRFGATYVQKGPALWPTIQAALAQMFPEMMVESGDSRADVARKNRERPLVLIIDDDPDIGKFLVTRRRKYDRFFAKNECGGAAKKMRGDDAAVDRDRPGTFDDRNYVAAACGHHSLLRRRCRAGLP